MSTGTIAPAAAAADDSWGRQPEPTGLPGDWTAGVTNPLDGLEFDSAEEGVKLGGGKIEIEGAYHLEIRNAEWPKDEHGNEKVTRNGRRYINVQLVALASVPGLSPAGSSMWHEIELPNPEDREQHTKNGGTWFAAILSAACEFCVGCGIFKKTKSADGNEIIIDTATGTTKLQFATVPERLKGLQVIGRPKREEWTADETKGRKAGWAMRFPWGNGVSQIGDPQNANVPMFQPALDAAGLKRYVAPIATGQVQAPAGRNREAGTMQYGSPAANAAPTSAANVAAAPAQSVAPAVPVQTQAVAPAGGQYDDL